MIAAERLADLEARRNHLAAERHTLRSDLGEAQTAARGARERLRELQSLAAAGRDVTTSELKAARKETLEAQKRVDEHPAHDRLPILAAALATVEQDVSRHVAQTLDELLDGTVQPAATEAVQRFGTLVDQLDEALDQLDSIAGTARALMHTAGIPPERYRTADLAPLQRLVRDLRNVVDAGAPDPMPQPNPEPETGTWTWADVTQPVETLEDKRRRAAEREQNGVVLG